MDVDNLKRYFLNNVLGKYVKILVTDGRIFYGELECIDNQKNIVLKDALEEIPLKYVSPINKELEFYVQAGWGFKKKR